MNSTNAVETSLASGVLTATLRNPPCNVISPAMYRQIVELEQRVRTDDAIRVLVLQSGDPDFFLAHYDVEYAATVPAPTLSTIATVNAFSQLCAAFRFSLKPSLVKIAGRAGGGGIELAAACDMRFGVCGRTVFNQMEVPLGILPGGGGTQNLLELLGRGRALEMILGADDIDAETAADWGLLNRCFDTVEQLDGFVDGLARRIAAWPAAAVAVAKQAVGIRDRDWQGRLLDENRLVHQLMALPDRHRLMPAFMAAGGQTPEGEGAVAGITLRNAELDRKTD